LVTNQAVGIHISILQTSASGTAVYTETQTPTTNLNGLVTIEIGNGTSTDDFSVIDWSADTYFIKTEIDPTGGINYTITGISQLLSVPYALHAKTVETIIESDPVFVVDSSSFKTAIRTNIQAIQDTAIQIRADIPTVTTYSVGDFAQGGIVFWVDETGQHGLACAKEDQSTGIRWYAGTYGYLRATGDGLFSGKNNTLIIILSQMLIGDDDRPYAAQICYELQITEGGKTFGDWYLPSNKELNYMYVNRATIDATAATNGGTGFASAYYWSSTENSYEDASAQIFGGDFQAYHLKHYTYRVRAVRAF
jgi:hypothetical protein